LKWDRVKVRVRVSGRCKGVESGKTDGRGRERAEID
jgi:hypothetical protein